MRLDPTGRMYETIDEQPSPTSTIEVKDDPDEDKALKLARLLREIAKLDENLVRFDPKENLFWVCHTGVWFLITRPNKTLDEDRILGAISADCDARGIKCHIFNHFPIHGGIAFRAIMKRHNIGEIIGDSETSRLHAALLAYRDALQSQCTCESEDGWHLADVCPLGGASEELAGAANEDDTEPDKDKGMSPSKARKGAGLPFGPEDAWMFPEHFEYGMYSGEGEPQMFDPDIVERAASEATDKSTKAAGKVRGLGE